MGVYVIATSFLFKFLRILAILLVATMPMSRCLSRSECEFKAIFNFGDSNTDTGGFWAAFPAQNPPWGMTYFKKPAGRASDGRVIPDFLAQALGFPKFVSAYLQAIGSDFRQGANYATAASTVLLPNTSLFVSGISPFSLAIQLNQMKQFKALVDEFHNHSSGSGSGSGPGPDKNKISGSQLPSPDIFGKSLYTFYIGQNDFTSNLAAIGVKGVMQYVPDVINQIVWTIKELYDLGGRTFFVLNLAPVGCYPAFLVELPHESSDIDEFGCLISINKAVVEYNLMLKERLTDIRLMLPNSAVVYVDTSRVLLQLFRNPTHHGLKYGPRACCGYGGGAYNFHPKVFCGNKIDLNGRNVTAEACSDPYNYVSWDGIHATEAANRLLTKAILSGSILYPPFPLNQLCDPKPIA